jgi:hypothetical protein
MIDVGHVNHTICIDGLAHFTEAVAKPRMVFQSTDENKLGLKTARCFPPESIKFCNSFSRY